jgi:[ribosomal protein S18]-alanine N-acetyltransferase
MTYQTILYDAYTGISPSEKSALVRFLHENTENTSAQNILEAVEYAVKHKPSFGGFILVAHNGKELLAAIVANRTGMEGYNPKNIFVYVTLHPKLYKREESARQLLQKAIACTDGDIALHVEPDNPALQLYQKLGFEARYLELRFNKKQFPAVV